jgi:long-chain fatty acid transport protein
MEVLLPSEEISSSIVGVGSGSDGGDPGVVPIPVVGWVHHGYDAPVSVGLGVYGVGGYRVNYEANPSNPILAPQPLGLGRIAGELDVLQIAPTVAWSLSERLSLGVAPTLSLARLAATPLFLTHPDDANGDGAFSYPDGLGTRYHWGAGLQAGLYYAAGCDLQLGVSLKTPQWFETFRFPTTDELGRPRVAKLDFDYPLIVSVGAAFTGLERWLIACDVRYFDYANTDGFREAGFAASGAGQGLGWRSIVAVSTGLQYRLSQRLLLRGGYGYQQNPISSENTVYNVASPLIIQHLVSVGASWQPSCKVAFHIAYIHGFEAYNEGPLQSLAGPVAGTRVGNSISADGLGAGLTVRY